VRRAVFERDGGRCVGCGAEFDLQYDHVIPVALGGASTAENLELLCAPCNRRKGATLG
jgi:5-methylcytosine-specific restriction endonuclease McrA